MRGYCDLGYLLIINELCYLVIHCYPGCWNGYFVTGDTFVYAFGPMDDQNKIDDQVKITHANHSKVFSSIVFAGLTFLKRNPSKYLGIDGSNNARACMYYRCILNNYDYLTSSFKIYGINYFIRILRKNKNEENLLDADHILAIPGSITKESRIPADKLYNYFIFSINPTDNLG